MIKRERRPNGFTQIPNETLRDMRLKDGPYRLLMYINPLPFNDLALVISQWLARHVPILFQDIHLI